jgi:hypothetical protein
MSDEPNQWHEVGSTGLDQTGGYINQEWLRQLSSATLRYRAYSEMRDNDAVIGAILYAIESLIRQVEWTVQPGEDSEKGRAYAGFVEECFDDMDGSFEDMMSEVLTMLPYGYSLFEIVYKVRAGSHQDDLRYKSRFSDGRVGWRKFAVRGQDTIERWKFTAEGALEGAYQSAPPTYQEVFMETDKLLLFRTKIERNNPEGRSLLRNAYRSWYFLKRLQEIEAIGVERDLAGLPVMEVPPQITASSATSAEKSLFNSLKTVIQQIRRDEREGIIVPSEVDTQGKPTGFRLRLLSTGGSRQLNTDTIIRRYESRIAMSVLAEFILLGLDKTGSFALADSKTDLFATSLKAILDQIASVFNNDAIPRLMEMNNIDEPECWPVMTYGDIESQDLDSLSNYVQRLAMSGLLTPDPTLEDNLREAASLPIMSQDATPRDIYEDGILPNVGVEDE